SNTVSGTAASARLQLSTQGGSAYIYRTSEGYTPAGVRNSLVIQEFGGGDIVFWTYGGEVARITSGRNFGIGEDSPTATLGVSGTISATGAIQVGASALSCSGGIPGALRYNSGSMEYCNGTSWTNLSSSTSAGVTTIASLTDVQLTNTAGRDYLRYDAIGGKWVNISESEVMSTTTMLSNWPDAIVCTSSSTSRTLYLDEVGTTYATYEQPRSAAGGTRSYISFNAAGAYNSNQSQGSSDCVTNAWSISQLYARGLAFNFIGGIDGDAGSPVEGDRITSGTLAVVANSATSIVSLSTNGTTWGYLGNAASYLPTITANKVSSTNISGSLIQVGYGNGASCDTARKGAIRYSDTISTIEYCNSTAWVSMGPSATETVSWAVHKNNLDQTVTADQMALVTWQAERFDTNNSFSGNRFTASVPGKYFVSAAVTCGGSTSYCVTYIFKNGATIMEGRMRSSIAGGNKNSPVSGVVDMAAGDYLEVGVYNGGGTTVSGVATYTFFTGALLAPQGGGSGGGASLLDDLNDVNTAGAVAGSIIRFDGANWVVSDATSVASTVEGDRITSGTLAVIGNSATSIVSLTTNGTTWGYLGNAASFLPTIMSGKVSATNISASTIQAIGEVISDIGGPGGNFIASGTSSVSASSNGRINFAVAGDQRLAVTGNGLEVAGYISLTSIIHMTSGAPAIYMDDLAPDGYGMKRITTNDGSGNFNVHAGGYFDGSLKYAKTGDGYAGMTFNTEGADGQIALRVAPAGTAGNTVSSLRYLVLNSNGGLLWNGVVKAGGSVPITNNSYNLGSAALRWGCLYYNNSSLGTCASDARLKDKIADLSFGNALDKIAGLRIRSFVYREAPTLQTHGLVAQEVMKVAPELVVRDPSTSMYKVNYSDIQWLAVEALQQLNKKLDSELRAANDNVQILRSEIDDLRRELREHGQAKKK
ncbi:tail fiber domain-containing protein, partial [Filomicrobium sp.]|uniref:tail fiber domain-containing protein n=1 Tax=Filomicrobium sp. TaxID=2024831 RepID=UPI00258D5A51